MNTTYLELIALRLKLGTVANTSLDQTAKFLAKFNTTIETRKGAFMVCATKAACESLSEETLTTVQVSVMADAFGVFIELYHAGEVGDIQRSFRSALENACDRQPITLAEEILLVGRLDALVAVCSRYLSSRNEEKQVNGQRVGDLLKKYEYA
tara:strand:- start:16 stop:474 length:459 start_codon:yes stop_codon:yes gene_type:complete